ncbi:MAG: coenzyme F420-0:L-glutamate ligase [ANME-2 cluster archaeon]|nr:coenzyme F420-0:L-glutamate ligase [ANME-2 cluster archaeon]
MKISTFTVDNIPLIKQGNDIANIICQRIEVNEYDIIVIASTIVSKAEGRIVHTDDIIPTPQALKIAKKTGADEAMVQAVLDESTEVILESPIFLVRHTSGNICINGGVDKSNVEDGLLLLPSDPDECAKKLKEDIFRLTKKRVSVIITDTNGRAFREGQTGIALGAAGIDTHHDWRGSTDLFGHILEVANEAVVDELAGFANCLMGEGNWGTPVVVIRGLELYSENDGMDAIFRSNDTDIIRKALLAYQEGNKGSLPANPG